MPWTIPRNGPTNHHHRRGRDYDPWEHADALGIEVVLHPLRTANEMWFPDRNLIVVQSRLRAVHQRNALAHGVGHAAMAHAENSGRNETIADNYAAWHLVDPVEADDVLRWAPDIGRAAAELDITTKLLRAYLRIAG